MERANDDTVTAYKTLFALGQLADLPQHYQNALAGFLCIYHGSVIAGEGMRDSLLLALQGWVQRITDAYERSN